MSFNCVFLTLKCRTLILKHLHGDRVAAICLKWISATKVSKYGKSEYSRALNASYTFQPLMSFWYTNKDSNNRKTESARWTMEREGPRALSFSFAPASPQYQETSAEERDAHQLSSDPIMHNSGLRGCKGLILIAGVPSLLLPIPLHFPFLPTT